MSRTTAPSARPDHAHAPLAIRLLGGFSVARGACVVPDGAWRQRKPAALLKLLALAPGQRLHRERVVDALWPDLDAEAGANNLRVTLHAARRILEQAGAAGGRVLARVGDHLVLDADGAAWVDVATFEATVELARRTTDPAVHWQAADAYAGDLLPDDPYDAWLDAPRARLRSSYLAVLTRLAQLEEQSGDLEGACEALRRVMLVEPTSEQAHAHLMRLHALAGRRDAALAQYDELVVTLRRELDALPEPITRKLAEAIRAGHFPAARSTPLAAARAAPTNLHAQLTTLLGRAREMAECAHLLTIARLVTLTGPGGVGKTRLALQVATEALNTVPDGVFLVDLAPVGAAELVLPTIATTLSVHDTGERTVAERLMVYLQHRRLLLVLDNFEHLLAAAPAVGAAASRLPQRAGAGHQSRAVAPAWRAGVPSPAVGVAG